MRISKKIVVFVVGFCLPAILAIAYSLSVWFDMRLADIQQEEGRRTLHNIALHLEEDLHQFEMLAQIYGVPMALLPSDQQQTLSANWQAMAQSSQVNFYTLQGERLTSFDRNSREVQELELNAFLSEIRELSGIKTGFLLKGQLGYLVNVIPLSFERQLLTVRRVDNVLLEHYQPYAASVRLRLATTEAMPLTQEDSLRETLEVPNLLADQTLLLDIEWAEPLSKVSSAPMTFIYLVAAISLLLLLLGYLWLRHGVVDPLKQLLKQLAKVDPTAKTYQPVRSSGASEFMVISEQINSLLARIFQQKERSKITLEAIAEAVILTDSWAKVIYLNPQAERLLRIKAEAAVGMSLDKVFRSESQLNESLFAFMASGTATPMLSKVKFNSHEPRLMERSISNLRGLNSKSIGTVIVLRDITQEELLKHQLRRRANFDNVTGLLNRCAFEERLKGFAEDAQTLAICYLDLEQFKLINDSCGHNAGDSMLEMVAKAIQASLDDNGLLARLGGDEFGLALKDLGVVPLAQQVKQIIDSVGKQVMEHHGCHYHVGISAGVAMARAPYINPLELLKDADIACIAAKRKGSNQVHFYDDKDKELTYQRNAPKWAVRIAQAIEHNELLLYYQPIKALSEQGKQRMEVLLRIQEPCGRILAPAQFIAAAERFKLMTDVDKEVIRKTFLWLSLHEELWADHCLSINLSANSLGAEGMVEYIIAQLERFAIPSHCICFEITETSAIQNRNRAMEMLNQLKKQGFSFALDDFGTGFASYGYLRELPVNYVKIDGCFIKSLASNAKDYAIVKSIHDVCQVMGIETVAEFVENQEIIDRLRSIGINYAQGYAIGRPKSLESYLSPVSDNVHRLLA
ncbi:EAL domain-containing protein [Shewanella marisflavi]|uniref:putative bifunctional diguanylate cyclase/phosphodiesterase n=1 Tax=Shewanella marisflavi TaxID=260364 RepID=UPI00200C4895|nr:EAL domain-containing protein [Shewanella marisflavi]MCL1040055.1 EAL domain-containing protein [Shewanella marisflavi]